MPISFDQIQIGAEYDRPTLAKVWGYKGWQAIGRGVVTPSGEQIIILFVTEQKQEHLPQYSDRLVGNYLCMEGEEGHVADDRLTNAGSAGDQIHLFHRVRHHDPFTYYGKVELIEHQLKKEQSSYFLFRLSQRQVKAI